MGMLQIFTVIVMALIGFKLFWDVHQRKKGIIINHGFSAFMDTILYVFAAAIATQSGEWYQVLMYVVYGLALRWLVFDALYNLLTNKPVGYRGVTSKLDIYSKRLVASDALYVVFKGLLLSITIVLSLWAG